MAKHKPPKASAGDTALAPVRAGISAIPLIGSPIVEVVNLIVAPPLERRRQEWMESIGEGLCTLENDGKVKLEDLGANDAFIDTVLHATHVALRNSQHDKREALRNAVLNSALPSPPDESRQQMFVNFVDTLTVWHLKILKFLSDPPRWFQDAGRPVPQYHLVASISGILTTAFPELAKERSLYEQVGKDLHYRGLVTTDSFFTNMSPTGAYEKRATELGQQFIKFISVPLT